MSEQTRTQVQEKRHRLAAKREPGSLDRLRERSLMIGRRLTELVDGIDRVDGLLEDCGALLNVSQPPVTGKIGLRWWKLRGGMKDREPVVVIWKRGQGGRFYPERIGIDGLARRVKTGGGFALGCDVTRDVVRVMVVGLRLREELLKGLLAVEKASRCSGFAGVADKVDGWEVDVGYWRTVISGRLDRRFDAGG